MPSFVNIWLKTEGKPDAQQAEMYLKKAYQDIEGYVAYDKDFLNALHPHKVSEAAPDIIRDMSRYSEEADVGPMAGVAGAIAEYIGIDNNYPFNAFSPSYRSSPAVSTINSA